MRHQFENKLKLTIAEKMSGRIAHIWFCRVGLCDPGIPATTVEDICTDFGFVEASNISSAYVGSVRDCFAELITNHCYEHLQTLIFNAKPSGIVLAGTPDVKETVPQYIQHVQDHV
jgi:hypothetical protein